MSFEGARMSMGIATIRKEVDAACDLARGYVEKFCANTDIASMAKCRDVLAQVRGALWMVGIDGALLLVDEMISLAQAFEAGSIERAADGCGAMMGGLLWLPEYLAEVHSSGRDIPLRLMEVLNNLRAARGEMLWVEETLFRPRLDINVPEPDAARRWSGSETERRRHVRRLRQDYQVGLLRAMRGDREGLGRMCDVLRRLYEMGGPVHMRTLWWVAGGLADGLLAVDVERGAAVWRLFRQVDRAIAGFVDAAADGDASGPEASLMYGLLWYAGRCAYQSSQEDLKGCADAQAQAAERDAGGWCTRVVQHYDVARWMAAAEKPVPERDAMCSLAAGARRDLVAVPEAMDLFVRGGCTQSERLKTPIEIISRLGDTLALAGLTELRETACEISGRLEKICGGCEDPRKEIEAAAEWVVRMDRALERVERNGRGGSVDVDEANGTLQEVARTCLAEITAVRERLAEAWEGNRVTDGFEAAVEVRGRLLELEGVLRMSRLSAAADVIEGVTERLWSRDRVQEIEPDERERIAAAVSGMEYYIEALASGRVEAGSGADEELLREVWERLTDPAQQHAEDASREIVASQEDAPAQEVGATQAAFIQQDTNDSRVPGHGEAPTGYSAGTMDAEVLADAKEGGGGGVDAVGLGGLSRHSDNVSMDAGEGRRVAGRQNAAGESCGCEESSVDGTVAASESGGENIAEQWGIIDVDGVAPEGSDAAEVEQAPPGELELLEASAETDQDVAGGGGRDRLELEAFLAWERHAEIKDANTVAPDESAIANCSGRVTDSRVLLEMQIGRWMAFPENAEIMKAIVAEIDEIADCSGAHGAVDAQLLAKLIRVWFCRVTERRKERRGRTANIGMAEIVTVLREWIMWTERLIAQWGRNGGEVDRRTLSAWVDGRRREAFDTNGEANNTRDTQESRAAYDRRVEREQQVVPEPEAVGEDASVHAEPVIAEDSAPQELSGEDAVPAPEGESDLLDADAEEVEREAPAEGERQGNQEGVPEGPRIILQRKRDAAPGLRSLDTIGDILEDLERV